VQNDAEGLTDVGYEDHSWQITSLWWAYVMLPTCHTRLTYPTSCATDHTTWHLLTRQNFLITQTISFALSISTPT